MRRQDVTAIGTSAPSEMPARAAALDPRSLPTHIECCTEKAFSSSALIATPHGQRQGARHHPARVANLNFAEQTQFIQ